VHDRDGDAVHRSAVIGLLAAASLGGCVRYGPYPITRTVGGETRVGVFVAPAQYEDFVRGELAAARGAYDEARTFYESARAGGEDDVLLLARLADAEDRLGQRAQAEQTLELARALDPEAEIVWMTSGEIHERHDEQEAAISDYERAHLAAPSSDAPVLALARILGAAGRGERAAEVLRDHLRRAPSALSAARAGLALALERRDAPALSAAAETLARIAPGHTDEIEAAARALAERGDALVAHRLLSSLPPRTVDRELAIDVAIAAGARDDAERLLAFESSGSVSALLRDARHWLALNDAARAEELAEVARAEDPTDSSATLVLADARLAQGDYARAAELFGSIPRGSAAADEARSGLARALAAAGLPALGAELAR
jgi:tetratricopeptide (TPR) repeat protein